mgnify:CR=1 FL=1
MRVIFRQIRRLRQKLFRKNPIAASGLESVEVILRSREAQAQTQQGAARPNTVRNFMSTRGARPSRFSRADSRSLDKAKLKPGTRVTLDMTTLTIMRALPREVDPTVYHMLNEDPGGISFGNTAAASSHNVAVALSLAVAVVMAITLM